VRPGRDIPESLALPHPAGHLPWQASQDAPRHGVIYFPVNRV
jgi:hypothetical protein